MNNDIKEIFETLIKYANLTPDAIDDLYYLQGYIEEKDKEITRLNNTIDKAIEYIENDMPYLEEPDDDYENNHKMIEYDKSDLLNILDPRRR